MKRWCERSAPPCFVRFDLDDAPESFSCDTYRCPTKRWLEQRQAEAAHVNKIPHHDLQPWRRGAAS